MSGCLSWIPWHKVFYKVSLSRARIISRTEGKHPLSSFNKFENKIQRKLLEMIESMDLRAMVLGYNSIVCLVVRHVGSGICLPGIFLYSGYTTCQPDDGIQNLSPIQNCSLALYFSEAKTAWAKLMLYFFLFLLQTSTFSHHKYIFVYHNQWDGQCIYHHMSTVFCPDNRSLIR